MQESAETQCWLEFAHACSYITQEEFTTLDIEYDEIYNMLNSMEPNSKKFCFPK